tara:strand:+ start:376 stop:585 length:210 start_codon:yes stop_codon:yes gene_type:complete
MELPIDHKDLKTIVNALSLGGDTRLYFLLKNVVDNERLRQEKKLEISDTNVQIYSESDEYQCKHNDCDI